MIILSLSVNQYTPCQLNLFDWIFDDRDYWLHYLQVGPTNRLEPEEWFKKNIVSERYGYLCPAHLLVITNA